MRKRIATLTTLLALTISGALAQEYQVFKSTADVTVKKRDLSEWVAAERKMKVTFPDSLHIGEGGSISLLNPTNNQIIQYNKNGKCRIKNAVDASLRDAGNITAYTTQNIAMAVASKNKNLQYNVYGATMRGKADKKTLGVNEQLCQLLANLIAEVKQGATPKQSDKLRLERVSDEETFHFVIHNTDARPYVVNILRIPQEGTPQFCINLDKIDSEYTFALIDAESTLDLSSYIFLNDESTYALIATEEVFDAGWVENTLRDTQPAKAKIKLKNQLYILK